MSEGHVDPRLAEALELLRACRPFVESYTSRTGYVPPIPTGADDVLERIDRALVDEWPVPAPVTGATLPPDYWETAE